MKFPKAGSTTMAGGGGSTADCLMAASGRRLFGSATLTANRALWLRQFGLFAFNNTTGCPVALFDATQGAAAAAGTALRIVVWAPTIGATGTNVTVDFKHPGLKFTTDCLVGLFGASTATGVSHAWGIGYEA